MQRSIPLILLDFISVSEWILFINFEARGSVNTRVAICFSYPMLFGC